MEPTVLAGPVEFSPADIALILAVLAAGALLVSAPGWAVLAVVMGRRKGPGASPGNRWRARIGGGLLGIAVSAAVAALIGVVLNGLDYILVVEVVAGWGACWALAYALLPRESVADRPATTQGWGR
ncbi:MAG: hypothetical protein ACRDV1_05770 [Actinomycetes bacterium]